MALLVGLAVVCGAPAAAQTSDTALPRVSLDVVVTDARGQRADQLQTSDFSVADSGQSLRVDSARFVGRAPQLVAILLDEYHLTPGAAAARVRDAVGSFITDVLAPDDRVVVLRPLDSLLSIALSSERTAALRAVAAFDPRRGDLTPRSDLERELIAGAPARVEAARARIATSAINALVARLSVGGDDAADRGAGSLVRKTLILVSEGFAPDPSPRAEGVAPDVDALINAANRANVSVYVINPAAASGVADEAEQRRRASLRVLASATGGAYVEAPGEPIAALRSAQADANGYYALSFTVPSGLGGQMRTVDVKTSRREFAVRTRRAVALPAIRPPTVAPAPSFLSSYSAQFARRSSALIRPWFGVDRGVDGRRRVTFVWELAPRVPGDRRPSATPSRLSLLVTTLDGEALYSGVVTPVGSSVVPDEQARVSFDVMPGRLLVQMSIEDLGHRVIDRDVRDLMISEASGPVSMGTPAVLRARTARDEQQLAADANAIPVAARQFSRNERVLVRVPVIAAPEPPVVTARLRSAFGATMFERTAVPLAAAPHVYQFDCPLASLAAGNYVIEIEVISGGSRTSDRVPIRVTP